jgi:hypothetical protein
MGQPGADEDAMPFPKTRPIIQSFGLVVMPMIWALAPISVVSFSSFATDTIERRGETRDCHRQQNASSAQHAARFTNRFEPRDLESIVGFVGSVLDTKSASTPGTPRLRGRDWDVGTNL